MHELSIKTGFSNVGVCPLTPLDSARLLPCARRQRRQVVEGTHHVIAEGTGLEPYSPCQGLVRGQGGFQDVQACVDLTIHFPVAHQAYEHLAHPISAPSATHWAGLGRPCWIDLDYGHAGEGGLVLDLAMNLAPGPRVPTTICSTAVSSESRDSEVLQNDCGLVFLRDLDEPPRDEMEPLAHSIPFTTAFESQNPASNSPVVGFLARESPTTSKVCCLDQTNATERRRDESCFSWTARHSVHRVLIRVECD